MVASGLINEHLLAGLVLVLAFISFAIGASLPLVGEKGNTGFYSLPRRDYLLAITDNAIVWRWANIFMGAAAVILVAGLALLTSILESANERTLSRLGLVGFQLAAALWVIFSAWRATVTVDVAQTMATTDTTPTYFEPLDRWASALFYVYALIGFLALAAYGGSLLQVDLLPAWTGWVTILFSSAMLILLVITGDTLPAFHYVPPLLVGILLLLGR